MNEVRTSNRDDRIGASFAGTVTCDRDAPNAGANERGTAQDTAQDTGGRKRTVLGSGKSTPRGDTQT